jgi:hypothetical protein
VEQVDDQVGLVCGTVCTPQILKAIHHEYGIDLPLFTQYGEFVK